MKLKIPSKSKILSNKKISVDISSVKNWQTDLGEYTNASGVYVIHGSSKKIYVGIAIDGKHGNFTDRLRRHFLKGASKNSRVHQTVTKFNYRPHVVFFTLSEIDKMIDLGIKLSQRRKAFILEQILIDTLGGINIK